VATNRDQTRLRLPFRPSRPPADQPAPGGTIRADLSHVQARKIGVWRAVGLGLGIGVLLTVLFVALWVWKLAFSDLPTIPDKAALWSLNRPAGATFVDRNGVVIGQRGPKHGAALTLAELPPYLPKAFLAAEDRRFYSHHGIDLTGIARAARNDLKRHKALQGGSTITQQIARTLFLSPEQTLRRKLQEAGLAVRIEHLMSKDEILALYLNRIYFGGGAYGVDAAARTYFGKSARNVNLSEAALLAALPKAPTKLAPTDDFQAALKRSHLVLRSLVAQHWITPQQAADATAHPPVLATEAQADGDFGYVLDLAAQEAKALNTSNTPDLVVHLTIDSRLQAEATHAVRDAVARGYGAGATQAALISLGTDGGVRALVGGADHRLSAFDRAVQAQRQPGSAFKAFVYAAALEANIAPDDVREDAPVNVGGWRPANADGLYAGNVTLTDAFARSINTVAVRLTQEVGPARVAEVARRFGLTTIPPHPATPVALGAYETSLIDITSGYQVFQLGGRRAEPFLIDSITDARGQPVYRRPPQAPQSVYDATRAAQMTRMMQAVIDKGTGRRAALGRPAAGKTGTSQDYRDAWFVGFTPDYVTGVWMGDDRGRPMTRVAGGELPAETWKRFMLAAEQGLPVRPFAQPTGDDPADPRTDFYHDLADQFGQAASSGAPLEQHAVLGGKL
jgi:penicillin-binding protein 1A